MDEIDSANLIAHRFSKKYKVLKLIAYLTILVIGMLNFIVFLLLFLQLRSVGDNIQQGVSAFD